MKKSIIVIVLYSFVFIQNGFSQNTLSLSLGGGYIPPKLADEKLAHWNTGSLFDLSAGWQVTENMALIFSASYQKHLYDEDHRGTIVAQVVSRLISRQTENSTVYDLSLATRWTMSSKKVKPFIGAGLGLLLIDQGKIEVTYQIEGTPNNITTVYSDSDKNYAVAAFNLDLGYEIELKDNIALVLDGKLIVGLNGPSFIPVTAAIKFGL